MVLLGSRAMVQMAMVVGDTRMMPGCWNIFLRLGLLIRDAGPLMAEPSLIRDAALPVGDMAIRGYEVEEQAVCEPVSAHAREEGDENEGDDGNKGTDDEDEGEEEEEEEDGD